MCISALAGLTNDVVATTNLYIFAPWPTLPSFQPLHATANSMGINAYGTSIEFVASELGLYNTNRVLINPIRELYVDASNSTFHGDVTISGNLTTATNILWVTNVVWSTNAFYYPTNSQAASVNLGNAYGDLQVDGTSTVVFSLDDSSKVADTFQTAVVLLRNTSGNVTNITAPTFKVVNGTPYVTNETVCTVFYHGRSGDIWTNMVCLPLW